MKGKWVVVSLLTLIASLAPDIVVRESAGFLPGWWFVAKIALLLAGALILALVAGERTLANYSFVLAVIVATQMAAGRAEGSAWWGSLFAPDSFSGAFGGAVLLKALGILPVVAVLLLLFRSPRAVYLVPGDLSTKASRIGWLGIEEGRIGWGRLAVISGLLIAAGTLLLTLLTVTGFSVPETLDRLPPLLPLIVLLALVNSFSEGVVYRSAVLGPLKDVLPQGALVMVAAAFFGVAHFYGVPRGIVGVIMSGVLGWFMCRSMVDTKGFVAAWVIHFLQDLVIFSTIVVLGGW